MTSDSNQSLKHKWWKLHRRYLPIILAVALAEILLTIIHQSIVAGKLHWAPNLVHGIVTADLIIIPLAAINSIFFLQVAFARFIRSGWKMIALKITGTLLGVLVISTCLEQLYLYLGFVDDDYVTFGGYEFSPSTSNILTNTVMALALGTPIFIWQLRVEELHYQLLDKELEQQQLEQLKTKAELHALQSRINPHFLFNSFNSIASLITSNPDKAEEMVLQLSALFRYTINSESLHFVTVADELQIVETYLGIEKVRFGENLDYQISVSETAKAQKIPRFLIQPLIENAVKHATSKIRQGEIKLVISDTENGLILNLYDNGPLFEKPLALGYGLQSTYDKLNLLYPGKHHIEILNTPQKHVHIELIQ